MRKLLSTALIGGTLLLGACTPAVSSRIMEDDPRFDCNTMGNKICGPVSIDQDRKLVLAANGEFPYDYSHGFGDTLCAYRADGTPLACSTRW